MEHFGYPCKLPEEKPLMKCPKCGEELYLGDKVFRINTTEEIIGCENCVDREELWGNE